MVPLLSANVVLPCVLDRYYGRFFWHHKPIFVKKEKLKVMIFNFWTGWMEYRSESQSDRLFGAKQEPELTTLPQQWTRPLCLADLGTGTPSSQCDTIHSSEDNGSYSPCRDNNPM